MARTSPLAPAIFGRRARVVLVVLVRAILALVIGAVRSSWYVGLGKPKGD